MPKLQLSNLTKMGILWGKMYYAFAKEIMDQLGQDKGKRLLINCIYKYAKIRGEAIADYVKQQHFPYDAKSFVDNYDSCWRDLQNAFLEDLFPQKQIICAEGTTFCPYLEIWKELEDGKRLGLIYCEEFHKAMWAAYHPELRIRQDRIMTRDDDMCTFYTYMEGEEEKAIKIFDQK